MKETVLVIEENSDFRENITEILEMSGYRVLAVNDDIYGYEMISRASPDVIILDAEEKRNDNFVRLLSVDSEARAIPMLLLDGALLPLVVQRQFDPLPEMLSKPFTAEELLHALRRCFDKKNRRGRVV